MMSDVKGTYIAEDSYALVITADNQLELITPASIDGQTTNGHMLMLGIVQLIKTPGWADMVIEQTVDLLNARSNETV